MNFFLCYLYTQSVELPLTSTRLVYRLSLLDRPTPLGDIGTNHLVTAPCELTPVSQLEAKLRHVNNALPRSSALSWVLARVWTVTLMGSTYGMAPQ